VSMLRDHAHIVDERAGAAVRDRAALDAHTGTARP